MSPPPVLAIRGLCRSWGGVAAIADVSLDLPSSAVLAIIGPNGSGKTTLVNLVTGLIRPDAGVVLLDGRPAPARAHRLARRGVARTFQDGRLLAGCNALDNVLLGLHGAGRELGAFSGLSRGGAQRRRRAAMEALESVGLAHLWHRWATALSHGQRRRVEIARAMVGRPRLLVLDEPTGGLPPDDSLGIAQLVLEVRNSGAAVLLVEHDLDVVGRVADRVAVLDAGRVAAVGVPSEVLGDASVSRLLGVVPESVPIWLPSAAGVNSTELLTAAAG